MHVNARLVLAAALALAGTPPSLAQHAHGAHHPPAATSGAAAHGPYAGLQGRSIKALSEQQVADLRAGKGMSLALAAELNGYPGPLHVLELAAPLKLSAAQQARTRELFAQMQQQARGLGEQVIRTEGALDALFKHGKATREAVSAASAEAAEAQGRLRAAHLHYHLAMMDVLSPEQVQAYARLRGY